MSVSLAFRFPREVLQMQSYQSWHNPSRHYHLPQRRQLDPTPKPHIQRIQNLRRPLQRNPKRLFPFIPRHLRLMHIQPLSQIPLRHPLAQSAPQSTAAPAPANCPALPCLFEP